MCRNEIKLSIVIPVYNVEQYLNECLESVFNQGLDISEYEVLLVDDGSVDSSLSIAKRWADLHSNIKVFHQKNQGQAIARNMGIDMASGKYLMFIDSDDYLYPDSLLNIFNEIKTNNYDCIRYVIGKEAEDGSVSETHLDGVEYNKIYSGEKAALKFSIFGSVCNYIFRTALFKENNLLFKAGIAHEDSELCFRLFPIIKTMVFKPNLVYHYRYNLVSTDRSENLNSVRKRYNSDLIIASYLKKYVKQASLSKELSNYYCRIANSMIISHHKVYLFTPELFENKKEYFSLLKNFELFPLSFKYGSFFSRIASIFINLRFILKL